MKISNNDISDLINYLYPINRSITGKGNILSLKAIKKLVPIKIRKFKSGEKVYDWVIPDEWNISEAWIKDLNGNKIIDFKENNLHVVSYSKPIHKFLKFNELKKNLYFDPKDHKSIPYRTSYYRKDWGFCVNRKQYDQIKNKKNLEVFINSSFKPNGYMHYGELVVPGRSRKEILISTYICHPSMANDNLSGMIMTTLLADFILKLKKRKNTYRILFIPETIGAIAYCKKNEKIMKKIDIGLVISTVGGPGRFTLKKSWNEKHYINNTAEKILRNKTRKFKSERFNIHGSDERQFSSQAFRINTITISKSKYYDYKEYHTSLDNLDFMNIKYIFESLRIYKKIIEELEKIEIYVSNKKYCEPMLSKYNLYPKVGGLIRPKIGKVSSLEIILWLIFLCDGNTTVEQISKRIGVDKKDINKLIKILINNKILEQT